MSDPTESIRREMVAEINTNPSVREELTTAHGQVWDTEEMSKEFEPLGFQAPFILVRRREDKIRGTLMFQHNPRLYYSFKAEG